MDKAALMKKLKSDTRSKDEIYQAICDDMRRLMADGGSKNPTEAEIHDAARNLIGFCTALVEGAVERDKIKLSSTVAGE
ncbi:MAG: hypothetical protein SFW64_06750 [Alphaproteobacteria bacterium]|nr:hypothetical protein [Alphaproteobacteria bacterium]